MATRSAACVDFEAGGEFGVLGGDADGAAAGVAVVAGIRGGADLVVVFDIDRLVAIEGDQERRAEVAGVGAEGEGLGAVGAVAQAAGDDELHLAVKADIFEGGPGLADGGQGRDAGVLLEQLGRGAGSPFHAVDHDHVGARLGGQPDVVEDPRGPHLDEDRHPVVGRLAQLFDLDHQVVGAEEVGMPAGRALIDAGREVAQAGDLVGDLRAQQQARRSPAWPPGRSSARWRRPGAGAGC